MRVNVHASRCVPPHKRFKNHVERCSPLVVLWIGSFSYGGTGIPASRTVVFPTDKVFYDRIARDASTAWHVCDAIVSRMIRFVFQNL